MIKADTGTATVPPTPHRERKRRLWWVLGGSLAVLGVVAGAAALYEVPKYTVSPGSVWATEPLITVSGADSYSSDGAIGFTTVSLSSQRTSALEAFFGWLDPAVDVVDEELILGDDTPDQNQQRQQQFMLDSKLQATAVALETLGYDAAESVGARVLDVDPALPAGEILEAGDVIVAADGQRVRSWRELVEIIVAKSPGDVLTLEIVPFDVAATRCGHGSDGGAPGAGPEAPSLPEPAGECDPTDGDTADQVEVSAELTQIDDDPDDDVPPRPLLGIIGEDVVVFHMPVDIDIDSGDVGGPSAGLAFTLGVLEALTPEDLTGGANVAVTGTMSLDGTVGPVGGVYQKVITARREGVDLFIVPSSEYDAAMAAAGDLRIETADTLEEALAVLGSVGGETQALQQEVHAALGS
jgi:PDZ domain-containing protein